jgi:hypothetical protein
MQPWIQKGILDIRVPVAKNEEDVEAATKYFLNWANLHMGGAGIKSTFFNIRDHTIPFFDHFSSSQIAAEIKEHCRQRSSPREADPLFLARIFLYFAQELDRQNQEILRDLRRHQEKEKDLLQELKMEEDSFAGEFKKDPVNKLDDSFDYMIEVRLEAWTRMLLKDTAASGLFVTHSKAIVEYLLDKALRVEKLRHWNSIPLVSERASGIEQWQDKLMSALSQMAENKRTTSAHEVSALAAPGSAAATGAFTVYLVPSQMPQDFFAQCVNVKVDKNDVSNHPGKFQNTLIGYLEI